MSNVTTTERAYPIADWLSAGRLTLYRERDYRCRSDTLVSLVRKWVRVHGYAGQVHAYIADDAASVRLVVDPLAVGEHPPARRCGRCGKLRRRGTRSKHFCNTCLKAIREAAREKGGFKPWVPGGKGRPPLSHRPHEE